MWYRRADTQVGPYFLLMFGAGHLLSVWSPTLFEGELGYLVRRYYLNQQNLLALELQPGFFRVPVKPAFQWFNTLEPLKLRKTDFADFVDRDLYYCSRHTGHGWNEYLNRRHDPNQQNLLALELQPGFFFRVSVRSTFQWFKALIHRQSVTLC